MLILYQLEITLIIDSFIEAKLSTSKMNVQNILLINSHKSNPKKKYFKFWKQGNFGGYIQSGE